MRQTFSRGVFAAFAATSVLSLYGSAAFADSQADGVSSGSPGVLSGNVVQVPLDVPVNACGNTVNVVAVLNPAFGNTCVNGSGAATPAPPVTPAPPATPTPTPANLPGPPTPVPVPTVSFPPVSIPPVPPVSIPPIPPVPPVSVPPVPPVSIPPVSIPPVSIPPLPTLPGTPKPTPTPTSTPSAPTKPGATPAPTPSGSKAPADVPGGVPSGTPSGSPSGAPGRTPADLPGQVGAPAAPGGQSMQMAQTGAGNTEALIGASAASAVLMAGGTVLYRRGRSSAAHR
ncbi:chaplin [Streptomyces sp. NPDC046985]|uniref:chaplin n=1 Tax=Streptomyces sp. NPDC046985 TaxID=3155377 RepID=UPI0033DA045C